MMKTYQKLMMSCERSTVTCVITGSFAPADVVENCLSTPAKTGTTKTTRAIITIRATLTTTLG